MGAQLQITVREMPHSDALEAEIRRKVAGLERVHPRITTIRATVAAPHQHHQQGNLFTVKLELAVPGKDIVVNRDHAEDVYVALRDAFQAARRQLIERVERGQPADKAQRARKQTAAAQEGQPDE